MDIDEFNNELKKLRKCKRQVSLFIFYSGQNKANCLGRVELIIDKIKKHWLWLISINKDPLYFLRIYEDKVILESLEFFLKKGWIRTEQIKFKNFYFVNPEIIEFFYEGGVE